MPDRRANGNLIIGGTRFNINVPIINWTEYPYWDATSELCKPTKTEPNAPSRCTLSPNGGHIPYQMPKGYSEYTRRYFTRPALRSTKWKNGMDAPYEAVKSVIKKFVIHHDGCSSADMCWNVLQNERGLSCHFLIDNDGTVYQTIDLALMAYHASDWNVDSIGVELCNRGDAKKEPNYYNGNRFGPLREGKPCRINGHTFLAFDYTKPQYESLVALSRVLLRLLPNLPPEYPQSSPGVQVWDTMPMAATKAFAGYIGHYHLTGEKWDPGYFEFKEHCAKIRGEYCFFMFPKEPVPNAKPSIPTQPSALKDAAETLYKLNEQMAESGFFPVGPWGEYRLWHGGVHLAKRAGDPIYAPFPGRLVAARMGANSPIGSVNFLLLRHQMTLASTKVEFYSLYMHLADALKGDHPLGWMTTDTKDGWKAKGSPGPVVLLDEPIEAGALIGHVGTVGPGSLSKSQLHVEFFSANDIFEKYPNKPWEVIDGTSGGRFCDSSRINDLIDTNKDGMLSTQELAAHYGGASAQQSRNLVVLHVSEWTAEPSWNETLRASKDFKKLTRDQIDMLVAEQITPGLWWDAAVAAHAKLPSDGVVYHYHPVRFVAWVNEELLNAAASNTTKPPDAKDAKDVPSNITDDRAGGAMRSAPETTDDPCDTKLTLSQMVEGYDTQECVPQ
jgi:N-acetylmuramoyl-L-alanine amidase